MSDFILEFSTETALIVLIGDLWWSWDSGSVSIVLLGSFQCHQSWYPSELPSLHRLGTGAFMMVLFFSLRQLQSLLIVGGMIKLFLCWYHRFIFSFPFFSTSTQTCWLRWSTSLGFNIVSTLIMPMYIFQVQADQVKLLRFQCLCRFGWEGTVSNSILRRVTGCSNRSDLEIFIFDLRIDGMVFPH